MYTGRALIQFDLAGVSDTKIEKAELCMYPYDCFDMDAMWDYNMRNGPKKVFRVKTKWQEATANWNTPWTGGGGDFDENSPLCSSSQKDTTVKEWERFDVTETVQEYVNNPSSNFGFLIMFDDNDRRGIMVYSSQSTETDKRPKLVINGDGTKNLTKKDVSVNSELNLSVHGGGVWLHLSTGTNVGRVTLYSVDGKIVAALDVDGQKTNIQLLKQVTPGAYFVKYESNNKSVIKKSVLVR